MREDDFPGRAHRLRCAEAGVTGVQLRSLLTWIASPFGLFVCGMVLSVTMTALSPPQAPRFRLAGVALCVIAALQLIAFSWSPVADLVTGPLEERARTMAARAPPDGYSAILLLGGVGNAQPAGSAQHLDLGSNAGRIWLAARLYHAGIAPRIIVSGGSLATADGTVLVSEAESMRPVLLDLGVPIDAILLEPRSLNIHENARESRPLIGDQGNVALVTSAFHMPRAMREMHSLGIHAYAFPTDFRIRPERRPTSQRWLPTAGTLELSTLGIKEWLGMFVQSITMRNSEAKQ